MKSLQNTLKQKPNESGMHISKIAIGTHKIKLAVEQS